MLSFYRSYLIQTKVHEYNYKNKLRSTENIIGVAVFTQSLEANMVKKYLNQSTLISLTKNANYL